MSSKAIPSSEVARPASRASGAHASSCPVPDSSQNRPAHSDGGSNGKEPSHMKRKRCNAAVPTDDLLKSAIFVKPHPSSLQSQPRPLSPLMLLPRENLTLSSLDLSNPHGIFPAARFYESSIKILELEGRLGSNILLARSEATQTTYAIERGEKGLYTVCKLGSWVDVTQLTQFATAVCSQRIRALCQLPSTAKDLIAISTVVSHHENKKRRLAIEELQSVVKRRPKSQGSITGATQPSQVQSATPVEVSTGTTHDIATDDRDVEQLAQPTTSQASGPAVATIDRPLVGEDIPQPTAGDIFQNIRTQYLDILYHSMGSLAYFAKGPLSRARAAFHLDCDSDLEMGDLIEFLKDLVMTTALIDKKYRETVPEIVSKTKTHIDDSDNGDSVAKKRKTKKAKLGKDGLYQGEDDHVRRWWGAHKPAVSTDDDSRVMTQEEVKYHISCLRRRETQLQMILILEILALEPLSRSADDNSNAHLPGLESQTPEKPLNRQGTSATVPKKRNKHNLPFLLDIHADRLCIWQTTTQDDVKALAESQVVILGQGGQNAGRASSDPLKDFCVDIIVPFFSARLPELCDSINRKLGGPIMKPPPKPKQSAKPTSSSRSKPSVAVKKAVPVSRKARERTIEEVLSKEKMRRSVSRGPDAISLLRSASVQFVPTLKREASEPALSTIPKGDGGSLKERSVNVFGMPHSMTAEELRARKKLQIECELQDAISALKKPNRALAGREISDAAARRASTGSLKKLKKPTRSPAVQVKATPANNRFRDVLGEIPQQGPWRDHQLEGESIDRIPSSASVVPSTAVRKKSAVLFGSHTITETPGAGNVQSTPARASSQPVPRFQLSRDDDHAIPTSPTVGRKVVTAKNQQLLSAPRSELYLPSSPGLSGLFETPLKPRSAMMDLDNLAETPIKSRLPAMETAQLRTSTTEVAPANGKQRTIFQQLGWDEDDDLI